MSRDGRDKSESRLIRSKIMNMGSSLLMPEIDTVMQAWRSQIIAMDRNHHTKSVKSFIFLLSLCNSCASTRCKSINRGSPSSSFRPDTSIWRRWTWTISSIQTPSTTLMTSTVNSGNVVDDNISRPLKTDCWMSKKMTMRMIMMNIIIFNIHKKMPKLCPDSFVVRLSLKRFSTR